MSRLPNEMRRVWTAPSIIAVATTVSLVGALVTEDFWDGLASLVLFAVLVYATMLGLRSVKT